MLLSVLTHRIHLLIHVERLLSFSEEISDTDSPLGLFHIKKAPGQSFKLNTLWALKPSLTKQENQNFFVQYI